MIFRYYLKTLVLLLSFINCNSFQPQFNICKPMKSSKISLKMNNLNRSDFNNIALGFLSLSIQNIAINKFLIKSMLSENNQKDIFKRTSNSVCFISTEYSNIASNYNINTEDLPKGVGTGFIWDNQGHIVTNFHVINKVDSAKVIINNRTYDAKITGIEPEKDIAVLKIDINKTDKNPIPITIGNINDVLIGQYSYAIGNPFGQDHTFTMGIISGKNREITSPTGRKIKDIIQTDTAINPGNSGGPLLNSNGEIIGMNTAIATLGNNSLGSQSGSIGLGFAIPINQARTEIINSGKSTTPIAGISVDSTYQGVGARIAEVVADGPASKTDLKTGDVVTKINGEIVSDSTELIVAIRRNNPGDTIVLTVKNSSGSEREVSVVLGSREEG